MAGSAVPAVASAAAGSAVTLTIGATSRFKPVTGDVFVAFDARSYSKAQIQGTISGAASGDVARLFAQQFPYSTAAAPIGSETLTGPAASYSFAVRPTLATRYQVELFTSASATTPQASSATVTVYVSSIATASGVKQCARPVCREKVLIEVVVPASTLKDEISKTLYFYLGVNLAARKIPPVPKWLTLDTHATISKPKKIGARRFERTISFSFRIGNDAYHWIWDVCTKDTEAKDGLGLPGHHGCGAKRVRSSVEYLG